MLKWYLFLNPFCQWWLSGAAQFYLSVCSLDKYVDGYSYLSQLTYGYKMRCFKLQRLPFFVELDSNILAIKLSFSCTSSILETSFPTHNEFYLYDSNMPVISRCNGMRRLRYILVLLLNSSLSIIAMLSINSKYTRNQQ